MGPWGAAHWLWGAAPWDLEGRHTDLERQRHGWFLGPSGQSYSTPHYYPKYEVQAIGNFLWDDPFKYALIWRYLFAIFGLVQYSHKLIEKRILWISKGKKILSPSWILFAKITLSYTEATSAIQQRRDNGKSRYIVSLFHVGRAQVYTQ